MSFLPAAFVGWFATTAILSDAAVVSGTIGPEFPNLRVAAPASNGLIFAFNGESLVLANEDGVVQDGFHCGIQFSMSGAVVADSDGSVFVSGLFSIGEDLANLVKLRPDGTIDPEFRPIAVIFYTASYTDGGGIPAIQPDGNGGCFFGGPFNFDRTGETDHLDASLWTPVDGLGHADRNGRVTSIVRDPDFVILHGGARRIISDGDSLVAVTYSQPFRVFLDGRLEPFDRDGAVQWAANPVINSCYDPTYGLAVMGRGRVAGMRDEFRLCVVYNLDGTQKNSFQPKVWFSASAGASMAWDRRGRLLIGWVSDGSIALPGDPPYWQGDLNPSTPIWIGPGPQDWSTRLILDGFPRGFSIKRLLPDGGLDPTWSQALWFDHPTYEIVVLPSGDVITYGGTSACGFPTSGITRLHSEGPTEQQPQQSVRARLNPGGEPLIMGLIVPGEIAREVLIRAVGPSLEQFGVENPARATRVTVYAGTRRLVTAESQSNTQPVLEASERAGAFPLSTAIPGASSEGQLLLQLLPGAYTVHIELNSALPQQLGSAVLGEVYFF